MPFRISLASQPGLGPGEKKEASDIPNRWFQAHVAFLLCAAMVLVPPQATGGAFQTYDPTNLPSPGLLENPADQEPEDRGVDEGDYGIRFKCPKTTSNENGQAALDTSFCPFVVTDLEDIMAQPVLLIDPQNPRFVSFNALHGGRGIFLPTEPEPPSDSSRHNDLHQPHTTFHSYDAGGRWADNRYYAPEALRGDNRVVFGEDNAAVLDDEGRLYLASLYAVRNTSESDYVYSLAFWASTRINRPIEYYRDFEIHKHGKGEKVDGLHALFDHATGRVVVLYRLTSPDSPGGSVHAWWLEDGKSIGWKHAPDLAGPCEAISAPLAYEGTIYVGCLPAEGYGATVTAPAGEPTTGNGTSPSDNATAPSPYEFNPDYLQIHAINAANWSAERISQVPVETANAFILDRTGGHMLLVTSTLNATSKLPVVQVFTGALGRSWFDVEADFGPQLTNVPPGRTIAQARLTAAAYVRQTDHIHMIYEEMYEVENELTASGDAGAKSIYKTYGVARLGSWRTTKDLHFGEAPSPHFPLIYQGGTPQEEIFFDLHDSIVVWVDPDNGKERIFTAFGDYGNVRFGEVVEENAVPAIPLPPIQAPPIPLATAGTDPASLSAAAGLIFGAMLSLILAARRRKPLETPAGDNK